MYKHCVVEDYTVVPFAWSEGRSEAYSDIRLELSLPLQAFSRMGVQCCPCADSMQRGWLG